MNVHGFVPLEELLPRLLVVIDTVLQQKITCYDHQFWRHRRKDMVIGPNASIIRPLKYTVNILCHEKLVRFDLGSAEGDV